MDVRLATQVLLLQVAVVTLTLGIAGGLLAFMSHQRLAAQYEDRSLYMARAIAFAPAVRADVARYDAAPLTPSPALTAQLATGQLQTLATEIQQRTGVLFVVITNDQGIRLSHADVPELAADLAEVVTALRRAGCPVVVVAVEAARTAALCGRVAA